MSANLESKADHEASVLGFIERQFFTRRPPIPASVNLKDQTAVVTGANAGLGLAAMRQLLELGLSRAILAVRSQSKGDAAAAGLRASFPAAQIEVWTVDMASYDSIRAFARQCAGLPRLDIVILNAGLQLPAFERNAETGHETTFQVNYLSTVLLTILLLPTLRAKKQVMGHPARVAVVASDTAFMASLNKLGNPRVREPVVPRFDKEDGYDAFSWYADSKLMLVMGIAKLAEYVDRNDVVLCTVNPGLCAGTELQRGLGNFVVKAIISAVKRLVGRSATVGASTYLDAVLVQGEESHGSYCSEWTIKPYPAIVYTEEGRALQDRLWQETMEELRADDVAGIVEQLRS